MSTTTSHRPVVVAYLLRQALDVVATIRRIRDCSKLQPPCELTNGLADDLLDELKDRLEKLRHAADELILEPRFEPDAREALRLYGVNPDGMTRGQVYELLEEKGDCDVESVIYAVLGGADLPVRLPAKQPV